MAYTFGDITDATNTARRETPVVVQDSSGAQFTVQDVAVQVSDEGAVTAVLLTIAPA